MNATLGGFLPAKATNVFLSPSPVVPQFFTKELLRLGGKCDDGMSPRLRLVWGGTEMHFSHGRTRIKYLKSSQRVPIAWEVMEGEDRVRLPLSMAEGDTRVGRIIKDWADVGQQFFFLEEWCPPEEACRDWELYQYGENEYGEEIDIMGPRPSNGLYTYLLCLKTDEGIFMPPNEDTLNWVRKMLWLRDQDDALKGWSWRERPPARVTEGVLRQRYYEMYQSAEKEEEQLADRFYSLLKPATKRLTHELPNEGGGGLIVL